MAKAKVTTKRALLTSFFVNVTDVITNVTVSIFTGSTVMLSAALQGVADLTSSSFLLIGYKRAHRKADRKHPFGYGKELYFWSILAAFMILAVTATLSFYYGLDKFRNPEPIEWVFLAYAVLSLAIFTNGYALSVSGRRLLEGRSLFNLPSAFIESPLIAPKTVVVLDGMGTMAAISGLCSLAIYGFTGDGRFDGLGAMIIGVLLALSAIVLLWGLRGFITGLSVPRPTKRCIRRAALAVEGVNKVLDLRTMMLGSESMLVNIELHFRDGLRTDDIERIIDEVKVKVDAAVPGETHVQVEPETPSGERK